jgi:uncharacterized protein YciI
MFVVSIIYIVDLSDVDQHIEAHIAYLDKYYAAGNFIVSGRKEPRTGGVILARAESKMALDNILQEDPFAKAGIARYEVTEFIPTKMVSELKALLS